MYHVSVVYRKRMALRINSLNSSQAQSIMCYPLHMSLFLFALYVYEYKWKYWLRIYQLMTHY